MSLVVCVLDSTSYDFCSGTRVGQFRETGIDGEIAPVTSVRQTKDGNALLVSTLDGTIRLIDKGNGTLLQSYKGHVNKDYRIRSCLGMNDAYVVSGSEDGQIYVWDLLDGKALHKLDAHTKKVASAVVVNDVRKEWLSAGVDGVYSHLLMGEVGSY